MAAHWPTLLALFDTALDLGRTAVAAALLTAARELLIGLDLLDECQAAATRLRTTAGDRGWEATVATLTVARVSRQHGRHTDVVALCDALTGIGIPAALDDGTRLDVLLTLGSACAMCDDRDRAVEVLGDALKLADRLGDHRGQFGAHLGLTAVARSAGRLEVALGHAEQGVLLADRAATVKERALARFGLAWTHLSSGAAAPARRLAVEALDLVRGCGDQVGETWCLLIIARSARADGDLTAAAGAATESADLARRLRRPEAEAVAEQELARCLAAAGDLTGARAAAGRAMTLCLEFDSPTERRTTNRSAVADYNKNLNFFTTKDIATDGLRAVAWLYGFKAGGVQGTWFVDAHNGYGSQDSTPANLAPGTNAAIKVCARNGENGPLYHCVIHNFTVS